MSAIAEPARLRLNRLEVENFLRIKALQVDAEGHHVVITGQNGAGKTSAVDSIWAALGGRSAKDMPEPIHRGEKRARIELDLAGLVVERVWTAGASRLTITAADGSKIAKPQQLLDSLLGKYSLDPIAFLERRPQDQVDDVLAVCGVEAPVVQVQELTGEAHPLRHAESADQYLQRLSGDETGLFYLRRREAHRALEQKRAALEEQRQVLERAGGALRPEENPVSASDLLAELEQLQREGDHRRTVIGARDEAAREHLAAHGKLADLMEQRKREETAIAAAQAELDRRREALVQLQHRIERGLPIVQEMEIDLQTAIEAADAIPDPAPRIAALRERIKTVEQTNAAHQKRHLMGQQLARLGAERAQAEAEHNRLESVLSSLRGLRAHLLDGVELGVPGLEVGHGELRLNGVSFRQASHAERIKVACAVAFRQNPRLKLLRCDDAEHLDAASKAALLRMADENGWQVVMTCVAETEGLRVEIVGGDQ